MLWLILSSEKYSHVEEKEQKYILYLYVEVHWLASWLVHLTQKGIE